MSLYEPYFVLDRVPDSDYAKIVHNANGGLNFAVKEEVDLKTARLIELAIDEGKRLKEREILKCLGPGHPKVR